MTPNYNFPVGTSRKDPTFRQIERLIAGFRGYESLGDLRAADGQVREKLAEQLDKTAGEAGRARKSLERETRLMALADFDEMLAGLGKTRDELRSKNPAIAACKAYYPEAEGVGKVYALDFKMLSNAENAFNLMQEFQRLTDETLIRSNVQKISMSLAEIRQSLREKDGAIGCMIRLKTATEP